MLERMSAELLGEWQAFFLLGGSIREERADARFAKLEALVFNRTRGEKDEALGEQDFMPDWDGKYAEERVERRRALSVARFQVAAHQMKGDNGRF